ncbi:kynurenine 3-monooxygenase acdD [Physcomitrium patens]|uniref:FAD-binding domain-containing protein n=1 Tax=Physcomitrium patens TaxID=3218 RepID=A9TW57_PHYPA|nr:kynurenine 3-monooxygenase-like [Physcomitrium patens]PNR32280.1 hypothetical protein PHYPA_026406 [Physcomitrium patens]|eukprot:XP_024359909.1 kynurenine 3-monooxygenase-like [Physcomitrella patens]
MADAAGAGTVIVGAGPAGLLLAHLLLQAKPKPHFLPVRVFEARNDPRTPLPLYKERQYCVGLSARGQDGIKRVDGLWDEVEKRGMPSSQFVLHTGNRAIALKRNPGKPSLLINQRALAATLVSELESRYSKDDLEVNFNTRCERVDFKSRTVSFNGKSENPVSYNLLVGADGARSAVRNEFITQRGFDYKQTNMPYTFKVLYVPRPPELSEEAVHAFRVTKDDAVDENGKQSGGFKLPFTGTASKTSLRFSCFPTPGDGMSVLIEWSPGTTPTELLSIKSAGELKTYIEKYMPPLKVPVEAAEVFINQRPTSSMKVYCSKFHDAGGKAVLIGDAAHAMSNALGQGCNSSLQDVVTLSQCLHEVEDLTKALERYTEKQTREDHAAAYLSEFAFPQAKWVLPFFYLGNIAQPALGKVLPPSILAPPIQSLCSETLTPYSEIVRIHKRWLSFVEITNKMAASKGPDS